LQGPLAGISDQTLPVASFPYGTQVCEVEVDPDTGEVEIMRYSAVDDVGRVVCVKFSKFGMASERG
jgi:carbon-monoxide dehydrogenase large subunit